MFRTLFTAAIQGIMQKLRMNPSNLRLYFIDDDGHHILARIDAVQVRELLTKDSSVRKLRVTMGDVSYEVELN